MRKSRIDFGVEIDLDPDPDPAAGRRAGSLLFGGREGALSGGFGYAGRVDPLPQTVVAGTDGAMGCPATWSAMRHPIETSRTGPRPINGSTKANLNAIENLARPLPPKLSLVTRVVACGTPVRIAAQGVGPGSHP